jgi:hypothetical protein
MTSGQHIDYDALALEAQRGVVRACLEQVSRTGLLGDHHFYIAFNTQAPGIGMSKRLKEKYPVEMTIVLQHRFWDLAVSDDRFEVKLTFDGIPERLVVPFAAVKVFYDPSVPFILQFEEFDTIPGATPRLNGPQPVGEAGGSIALRDSGLSGTDRAADKPDRRRTTRKPRTGSDGGEAIRADGPDGADAKDDTPAKAEPAAPPAAQPVGSKPAVVTVGNPDSDSGADRQPPADEASDESGGAKIFDLSKFRGNKK